MYVTALKSCHLPSYLTYTFLVSHIEGLETLFTAMRHNFIRTHCIRTSNLISLTSLLHIFTLYLFPTARPWILESHIWLSKKHGRDDWRGMHLRCVINGLRLLRRLVFISLMKKNNHLVRLHPPFNGPCLHLDGRKPFDTLFHSITTIFSAPLLIAFFWNSAHRFIHFFFLIVTE